MYNIKILIFNLLWVLYPLTFFFRRNKNVWVFSSYRNTYMDNAKYLFEYISDQTEIQAVWIGSNREILQQIRTNGRQAHHRYSLKGMWYALTAFYYIYNSHATDVNIWFSPKAKKINLWHGIPLKKIGFDIKTGPLRKIYHPASFMERLEQVIVRPYVAIKDDVVLCPSSNLADIFASAFNIDKEKLMITGYPRLAPFFDESLSISIPRKEEFDQTLVYMPTWRDDDPNFITKAIPDFEALNDCLKQQNILLLLKLHPNNNITVEHKSNIQSIDSFTDIYPVLREVDGLITDYSSIMFDYSVLEKPIYFYANDLESYTKARGFYFDYQDLVQGKLLHSFDQLLNALRDLPSHSIDAVKLKNDFWDTDSAVACADIYNFLKEKAKGA